MIARTVDFEKLGAGMSVPDSHIRATNALLKAVDVARLQFWPCLPTLARTAAAGADRVDLDVAQRLELRGELARLMGKLSGYSHHLERDVQQRRDALAAEDERQFWLYTWEFLHKHAPDARLFSMFTKGDLLAELDDDEEFE